MSEARKCDRCKDFYDIAEEQQDKQAPYEFKGDYVNLHLWVARNGIRKDVTSQWYDLCPKCMMELECWLNNNEFPTNCELEETKEVEELEDPCDDCSIDIGQRNCIQCRYGYISVEDRKKRYAEVKKESKLSDPYEEGGL